MEIGNEYIDVNKAIEILQEHKQLRLELGYSRIGLDEDAVIDFLRNKVPITICLTYKDGQVLVVKGEERQKWKQTE